MIDWKRGIPIKVEDRLREKKREEEKLLSQHGITQEAFQIAVMEKIVDKSLSFILAVYQTLDEFLEREIKITGIVPSCKKGCSACCYVMITCTVMEIDEVIKFIKERPREIRRQIIREVRKAAIKWKDYFEKNKSILERSPFQVMDDWKGKPCPFLNKKVGICNIYPVRIIDCMTATSLTPCLPGMKGHNVVCELDWPGSGMRRFQCESWATNMIMDEQKRKLGHIAVTPLHHWLWIKERELY